MNKKFNIADEEIILFDDSTGNIVVPSDKVEGVSEEDNIIIHFIEDSDNIVHEYIVRGLETDGVHLEWVKMIDESVLTEANPIDAIKRKLKPTYADRVLTQIKKTDKANQKELKKFEKLVARDMSPEGQSWKFYLPNAKGEYPSDPATQNEAKKYYKNTINGTMNTMIADAIVVDGDGNFVRRGAEDLQGRKIAANRALFKLKPEFSMRKFLEEEPYVNNEDEDNTGNASQENSSTEDTMNDSNAKQDVKPSESKQYSDKLLNKLKDIALATGMSVKDPQGKEVDINKENMRNIDLDTHTLTIKGNDYPMRGWIEKAVEKDILTESCDPSTILVESLLFEAPQILFNDDELNNPDNINFKDIVKNRIDAEEQEKAKAAAKEVSDNLKSKYADAIAQFESKKLEDTYYRVENLFDNFVPSSGKADTVGGELVRAMMRILYRDYNDGDKFFEGYGLQSCGGSAEFLFDNCSDCAVKINAMLDASFKYEDDDEYTRAINALCDTLLTYLESHIELFYEPNEEDSREYTNEYIAEHQPTYEFELHGSDDIVELVDKGVLTSWDLTKYVEEQLEWEADYRGAEVANPWSHHDTTVVVTELTKDGYDRLSDAFNHDPEKWWADLVDEHANELEGDDEEYDDDYDLSDEE